MERSLNARGFTLLELLVVIALIAVLSFFLVGGLAGGSKSAALQSAQAMLANIVTAARTKAASSGVRVRLLINADVEDAVRFRRTIALQQETALNSNVWSDAACVTSLPDGVYVLPYRNRIPPGFYDNQAVWTKLNSSTALESSCLYTASVSVAADTPTTTTWDLLQFTPAGTMSFGTGDLVVAAGYVRTPGSFASGESPVQVTNPDSVRGVSLSTYGVPTLVNSRAGF